MGHVDFETAGNITREQVRQHINGDQNYGGDKAVMNKKRPFLCFVLN